MKIILTLLVGLTFSLNMQAQTSSTKTAKMQTKHVAAKHSKVTKDYFKMQSNMMMAVKGGATTTMSVDVMLKNGTVIKTDGTVVAPSGEKTMLKNGQSIDAKGHIRGVPITSK